MALTSRVMVGAMRGGFYGLLGGLTLGMAGSVVAPPIDYSKILFWTNRFGRKTRFTNLDEVSILKEDLYEVFKLRSSNTDAFNEAFRNIQSAITVYYPIKTGSQVAEVMTATSMTNFVIRASKALEALHVQILVEDAVKAANFQRAMMNIQLSMEEMINFIRLKSKNALPKM